MAPVKRYAIFIGDQDMISKGYPWVLADADERRVISEGLGDMFLNDMKLVGHVRANTLRRPVKFWLPDGEWYFEVRFWLEITPLL
jgi:hypothetical protein